MVEIIRRPAFRLDTVVAPPGLSDPMLPPPKRVIEQGKRVRPRGFRPTPPRGRISVGAAEAEARRIQSEGIKVSLGESTLSKLLDIKVPITDSRGVILVDSAGKPITRTVRVNLGDLNKSFTQKLDIIQRRIEEGDTRTQAGLVRLTTLLMSLDVISLKGADRKDFATSVVAMNYNPAELFNDIPNKIDGRYIDGPSMALGKTKEKITIYAISSVDMLTQAGLPVTLTKPFLGISGRPVYIDTIVKFLNLPASKRDQAVLDLLSMQAFISLDAARKAVGGEDIPEEFLAETKEEEPPLDVSGAVDVDDLVDKLRFSEEEGLTERQVMALTSLPTEDLALINKLKDVVDVQQHGIIDAVMRQIAE